MPAEDLKQSQLSQADDITIGDSHYLTGYVGTANFRISWLNIKKALLGVVGGVARTIGLNLTGSIVTTDAAQTLSNKTIAWSTATANGKTISAIELSCLDGVSNSIATDLSNNADAILSIQEQIGASGSQSIIDGDSEQVLQNKIYKNPTILITNSGADITIDSELKHLDGLSSNIITLLNGKVSRYGFTEPTLPSYSLAFTASGTSKTISASDILTSFGLSAANTCLSPNHFLINVMSINGSTYARTQFATTNSFSVLANGNGSDKKIDVITVSGLDSGKDYVVTILVKPIQVIAPA